MIVAVGEPVALWPLGAARPRSQDEIGLDGHDVVIRSAEHGAYWRDEGAGYTMRLEDAGVYGFAEAYSRTRHCGPEKKISYVRIRRVPTVIDDTFTAIVLRAPRGGPRPWIYFRFEEHGGPVNDPIDAHRLRIDAGLWQAEEHAKKHFPTYAWERAKLLVTVDVFSSEAVTAAMDESIRSLVRRDALAKLTDVERKALGL